MKKNLLVKDLRYFSWFHKVRNAFISLGDLPPHPKDGVLFLECASLLKKKGLSTLTRERGSEWGCVADFWLSHFHVIARFDSSIGNFNPVSSLDGEAFIIKDGALRPKLTEMREVKYAVPETKEVVEVTAESFWVEKGGLYFLETFLYEALQFWFTFPSFVHDLYKYSLEQQQTTELEEILLKAWLELPSAIDELYTYLRF